MIEFAYKLCMFIAQMYLYTYFYFTFKLRKCSKQDIYCFFKKELSNRKKKNNNNLVGWAIDISECESCGSTLETAEWMFCKYLKGFLHGIIFFVLVF